MKGERVFALNPRRRDIVIWTAVRVIRTKVRDYADVDYKGLAGVDIRDEEACSYLGLRWIASFRTMEIECVAVVRQGCGVACGFCSGFFYEPLH